MKSYILLQNRQECELPLEFRDGDVRYAPALVEHFLAAYTQEGDIVFDPFAGFGTTLAVAEAMNRIGFGIESDWERCRYARSRLHNPANLAHGDTRRLASYALPPIDFSLTSPPYMGNSIHGGSCTRNPLAEATAEGGGYPQYLNDIQNIYRQIAAMMTNGAYAVMEVSNLKHDRGVTTLAWDIAATVSEVLLFTGEVVVGWQDTYGYGYDHSYCLVFQKR